MYGFDNPRLRALGILGWIAAPIFWTVFMASGAIWLWAFGFPFLNFRRWLLAGASIGGLAAFLLTGEPIAGFWFGIASGLLGVFGRSILDSIAYDAGSHYRRGNIFAELGDYARAVADYTEAIRLKPDLAEAHEARAVAHYINGEHELAIADFTEAIGLGPGTASAHPELAALSYVRGDYTGAILAYTDVIRHQPDNGMAFLWRGEAYRMLGELDRAIADFGEALRLSPNMGQRDKMMIYSGRGCAFSTKGEHDRAIADYTEAIRFDWQSATLYSNRGVAYQSKEMYDEAIADFQTALRLNPPGAEEHQTLLLAAEAAKQRSGQ